MRNEVAGAGLTGWDRLRHGGLLLDPDRLRRIAAFSPDPLAPYTERELRRQAAAVLDGGGDLPDFVTFILGLVCGFAKAGGTWRRGSQIPAEWGRRAVTGETIKPRQLWRGPNGAIVPVFLDDEKRLGIGRGSKATSQTVQWLRAGDERLGVLTNGRQWRLIFAGLDFNAWCEWDVDLWLEEGALGPQVQALRTLLAPAVWTPAAPGMPSPLLGAIQDSRKGQSELSTVLGERVREAVELLVQSHGEVLKEQCAGVDPAEIYRAAARMVMRMVVVLFAETRELLPRDNALYHGSYGLTGLLEELEKVAARGGNRLARSWNAWPRLLALFRLVHEGSHHPQLLVPAYGGELFAPGVSASGVSAQGVSAPGDSSTADGMQRAVAVFETACFDSEILPDRDVHRMLERITRTKVKVRQGRGSTWVLAPVDFSDLSSEYIGMLYVGLLDFELKTAPAGDPVVFLAVGNQPALPLSRLEAMDDSALAGLLETMKDTSKKDAEAADDGGEDVPEDEASAEAGDETGAEEGGEDGGEDGEKGADAEADEPALDGEPDEVADADERHTTRTRAETWARRAVEVGKLARKPKGALTPEKRLLYEQAVSRKARQIVLRVILPGEWYLVRWGGTRKGSGTFYTLPGLAVPTVQRTLRPLAYTPPPLADGTPNVDAPPAAWTPKTPEEILALKVGDPACGSGTFPVAALRYLTEALYASLHHHGRVSADGDRAVVRLIAGPAERAGVAEEQLGQELLPCPPDDPLFEPRLKAILRRHVVERSIYGVDLDPLAVELCRLALWVETMDRSLPFSFLDHKVKCGNGLVGAWFDQFQHYPAMAWKNREGGDKGHSNGVHFEKEARTKAIKAFVKDRLTPDLGRFLEGRTLFSADQQDAAGTVHAQALATLSRLHDLPVQDSAQRARVYREELLGSPAYRSLKAAMDLWCACWFWPADELEHAPMPTKFAAPGAQTRAIAERVAARKRFFHWELEFPDVFTARNKELGMRNEGEVPASFLVPHSSLLFAGFDAILGNPPWDIAKPNSKEFFSNIDPLYRSYGKQEALRYQTGYFADKEIERAWLDYNADFRAQSNAMGYTATAFGDPIDNDKSGDRFTIVRGRDNDAIHARWRAARAKARGYADPAHPFRHQGSADLNLYKAFLEQAHALLRVGGRMGFVVPSGLYSDHGTGGLRQLFLDRCRWEWLFGFENRDGIFEIHRSFKFNPVIIEKGGRTAAIRTAFMRRKLEDWERGEALATGYTREQVERFSPRSKAILEIQSGRDLDVLGRLHERNQSILADDGPSGWDIRYSREFHITEDSKSFPVVQKWIGDGFLPSRYGHFAREDGRVALPVYEGRLIDQFDFFAMCWIKGKGRSAEWSSNPWDNREFKPQYLMDRSFYASSGKRSAMPKTALMQVTSATNARTVIAALTPTWPGVDKTPFIASGVGDHMATAALTGLLNSFAIDFVARRAVGAMTFGWYVLETLPLPARTRPEIAAIAAESTSLNCAHEAMADHWLALRPVYPAGRPWRSNWAVSHAERLRRRVTADVLCFSAYGLGITEVVHVLGGCDGPGSRSTSPDGEDRDRKGFWRVDKDKDPELRHTILTLVAFHDLEDKIRACGGDREKGIEAFLSQNDGEGWMLPENLRLADYGLGHDERAKVHQPVASRLGPRFYDWQLAQSAEESWRECHLHARNLLGEEGYRKLLAEIEAVKRGERARPTGSARRKGDRKPGGQGGLFE